MKNNAHHAWSPVPPMGWNSWDCYGASVTEAEVIGNAGFMASRLRKYGWEYVVVDIQWYEPTADSSQYHKFARLETDGYSRLMPAANRFPSSAGGKGFRPLADRIHSLGLKFGIHIMRGIPRQAVHDNTPIAGSTATAREIAHSNSICPWNTDMYGLDTSHPGALAYYRSLFELYASWGVDYVKVDDIAASRLYGPHHAEIALIHQAILDCGRPMILSLSPGPAPLESGTHYLEHSNLWRITDDLWDHWDSLVHMFDRCERWYPFVGPGHWPDCDMLPLGRIGIRSVDGGAADRMTRLTQDEQVTMMSLWAVFRSPLMFGGDLVSNDDWTMSLLANPEVLAVNQHGTSPCPVPMEEGLKAWVSRAPDGSINLGIFNLGPESRIAVVDPQQLGLGLVRAERSFGRTPPEPGRAGQPDKHGRSGREPDHTGPVLGIPFTLRDLWARKDLESGAKKISLEVPGHGARLLGLVPET